MNRLIILNQHEISPPPVTGGIEKRIKIFKEYVESAEISHRVLPLDKINEIEDEDLVLAFNLDVDSAKYLDYRKISTANTICGGFGPGERHTERLFNSRYSRIRFLSNANREDYSGCYEAANSFVLPHGIGLGEYYRPNRKNKYFLWTASLGWGMYAKGLAHFIELAYNNPDYEFLAYGGRWNSGPLEDKLIDYGNQIDNLTVKFDLRDEDKHYVYENAIALCQFTQLKEAGNTTTLEAMARECPVITLDGVNNASVDEYLGNFNYKFSGKFIDEKMNDWLQSFDFQGYRSLAQLFSVRTELSYLIGHLIEINTCKI